MYVMGNVPVKVWSNLKGGRISCIVLTHKFMITPKTNSRIGKRRTNRFRFVFSRDYQYLEA